ncbi:MAG: tRNA (adenosine(37)-N6)-threonylcarbamoyltransferase complex dimerization subunit type 1 TsaB [Spirochaetaceae bacterium]|jgi:tRNA threonylcarbamoyladenosine biosynthesis protein TsaB|nr:tRNA (adenosine(37)-N6)-threonylcarbamoyltransferase complex dimerization subunit type 1 TsaB [Spirochaetaceae bacterium]
MTILALDTASEIFSIALGTERGLFTFAAEAGNSHSEILCDAVESVLRCACIERDAISLTACMRGPGSFSGLRIGFAFAKGLSLALGKPYVSAPTLECIAYTHRNFRGLVIPLLDAKQKRFFCGLYREGEALTENLDIDAEALAARIPPNIPVLLTGPAASLAFERLGNTAGFEEQRFIIDSAARAGNARDLLNVITEQVTLNKSILSTGDDDFSAPDYARPAV